MECEGQLAHGRSSVSSPHGITYARRLTRTRLAFHRRQRRAMSIDTDLESRRTFLTDVGRLASSAALVGCAPPSVAAARPRAGAYDARVVLNVRTQAIGAAMTDQLWERYSLGAEYNAKDPATQQPAVRNPFWHRAPSPAPGITLPSMADLIDRGAIVLVCDFAMGHLSTRLSAKSGRSADVIHAELRKGLIDGAYAVPSGIFGLARAQNAGCAYVRV